MDAVSELRDTRSTAIVVINDVGHDHKVAVRPLSWGDFVRIQEKDKGIEQQREFAMAMVVAMDDKPVSWDTLDARHTLMLIRITQQLRNGEDLKNYDAASPT